VLDTGARGSTTTFVQRGLGDVLIAWENEAYLSLEELGPDKFDIVTPTISIKAEPPVALVDGNVDAKGTRKVAEAYLQYLYSDVGQKIAAKHFYRPFKPEVADPNDIKRFADVKLVTIDEFGGWKEAQPEIFWGRWAVRPDLQAGAIRLYDRTHSFAVAIQTAERHSGIRIGARRYFVMATYSSFSSLSPASPGARPRLGWGTFWTLATDQRTINALRISFGTAFAAALINVVFGTSSSPGYWCATGFRAAHHRRHGRSALRACRPPLPASR
jgi:hypothetical protein